MNRHPRDGRLLAEFFPPRRPRRTYGIDTCVEAGRDTGDDYPETITIEMKAGELFDVPDDWQFVAATEAAWQIAEGLGFDLRLGCRSNIVANLSDEEMRDW